MAAAVPTVEIADNGHAPGVWRPDGEMHPVGPLVMHRMGAKLVEKSQMRAFRNEVIIHRTKHGTIGVGIVNLPGAVRICRRVTQWLALWNVDESFEKSGNRARLKLPSGSAVKGKSRDLIGAGGEDAGNKALSKLLYAENGKGVSMRAGSYRSCFVCRKVKVLRIGVAHGSLLGHGPAFQISFAYWRIVRSEENQPTRAVLRIVRPYQASSSTHKLST